MKKDQYICLDKIFLDNNIDHFVTIINYASAFIIYNWLYIMCTCTFDVPNYVLISWCEYSQGTT